MSRLTHSVSICPECAAEYPGRVGTELPEWFSEGRGDCRACGARVTFRGEMRDVHTGEVLMRATRLPDEGES